MRNVYFFVWLGLLLLHTRKTICFRLKLKGFLIILCLFDECKCLIHVLPDFLFLHDIVADLSLFFLLFLLVFEPLVSAAKWSQMIPYAQFLIENLQFILKPQIIRARPRCFPHSLILLNNILCSVVNYFIRLLLYQF